MGSPENLPVHALPIEGLSAWPSCLHQLLRIVNTNHHLVIEPILDRSVVKGPRFAQNSLRFRLLALENDFRDVVLQRNRYVVDFSGHRRFEPHFRIP